MRKLQEMNVEQDIKRGTPPKVQNFNTNSVLDSNSHGICIAVVRHLRAGKITV